MLVLDRWMPGGREGHYRYCYCFVVERGVTGRLVHGMIPIVASITGWAVCLPTWSSRRTRYDGSDRTGMVEEE